MPELQYYDDDLERSQWLPMMYPRLESLRDLLSQEGSIWLTVDDNEAHYLRVTGNEVFGRNRPDPRGPIRKIGTTANANGGRFIENRFDNDESPEKRDVGLAWARLARPHCRFIMATHASKAGQSVADQIRSAIN